MADAFSFVPIIDALASKLAASGYYDQVNQFEAENPPNTSVRAGVWITDVRPDPKRSGLRTTAFLLVFNVRLYFPMMDPPDQLDPRALDAASAFFESLWGDFDLSGPSGTAPVKINCVDLQGMAGITPRITPGYTAIGEQWLRTLTVTAPVIVNDVFTQVR